jgi:putative peptidoglycan lipid II flippase
LVSLIAWGFRGDPEKFDLTVRLTRLVFPFLLFVCLAAMAQGALNALGFFFLPAVAPAMLSVAEISFVLLLARRMNNSLEGLAISAVAGGLLHFAIMVPLMRRNGLRPAWRWEPRHPDIPALGRALVPAVWGLSVDQINAYLDTICASFLVHGSVTALYNSNRVMQFPLSLFGIAMSTAALPSLSASAAAEKWDEVRDSLNMLVCVVFFLVVLVMVGLIILGKPITQLLFEHGRFTHEETLLTYGALWAYSLGLPVFATSKIFASSFYAMKDTKTPVKVATICVCLNMAGNLALMRPMGVTGLALASTIASGFNTLFLGWLLRRRLGALGARKMISTLALSGLATAAMAAASIGTLKLLGGYREMLAVPAAIAAGAAVYLLAARLLRMEEEQKLWSMIRTKAST